VVGDPEPARADAHLFAKLTADQVGEPLNPMLAMGEN
jgi:hypothetical protein